VSALGFVLAAVVVVLLFAWLETDPSDWVFPE
jgi:hypothetical protein